MTDRRHGTKARYCHGPDEHDQPGKGCRCDACTTASRRERKTRTLRITRGQWEPYVPAGHAREHVQWLAGHGIGYRQVTKLAGISQGAMTKLLYGASGRPPSRRIRPETEAAILAVQPTPANLAASACTDVTGTRRRLQALVAAGWPQRWLSGRLGKDWKEFYEIMTRRPQVEAATARAVAGLYDELWDQQPPQRTAAERNAVRNACRLAERRGWALPAAWDDDLIDDPAAAPEDCRRPRRLPAADLLGEWAELEAQGLDRNQAAERLGIARGTLDKALERTRKAAA
jgi:hypothetical protein